MTTVVSELLLQNGGENPLGFPVSITQEGFTIDSVPLSFAQLYVLPQVLPALRLAPDENTLKVDHRIYLEQADNVSGNTCTLDSGRIMIQNSLDNTYMETYSNKLAISTNDNLIMLGENAGKITLTNVNNIAYSEFSPNDLVFIGDNGQSSGITPAQLTINDQSSQKSSVITSSTMTCNNAVTSFTQMDGNQFRVSDAYGTQSESTLDNTRLSILNHTNSKNTLVYSDVISQIDPVTVTSVDVSASIISMLKDGGDYGIDIFNNTTPHMNIYSSSVASTHFNTSGIHQVQGSQLAITNVGTGGDVDIYADNALYMTTNSGNLNLTSGGGADLNVTSGNDLYANVSGNIRIDGPNLLSGQYLVITINGAVYKIKLENP